MERDCPSTYQTKTRRSRFKEQRKLSEGSRLRCQDEDFVTAAMGSVSIGTTKEALEVPSLAAYAKGAASHRGKDCKMLANMVLPAIPEPQSIPLNFSSRNEYLKVMNETQSENRKHHDHDASLCCCCLLLPVNHGRHPRLAPLKLSLGVLIIHLFTERTNDRQVPSLPPIAAAESSVSTCFAHQKVACT